MRRRPLAAALLLCCAAALAPGPAPRRPHHKNRPTRRGATPTTPTPSSPSDTQQHVIAARATTAGVTGDQALLTRTLRSAGIPANAQEMAAAEGGGAAPSRELSGATMNALLFAAAKCRRLALARRLHRAMTVPLEPRAVAALVNLYRYSKDAAGACRVVDDAASDGVPVSVATLNAALAAVCASGDMEAGCAMLAAFPRSTPPNTRSYNTAIGAAAASGDLARACGLVAEMERAMPPDAYTVNVLVSGAVRSGRLEWALRLVTGDAAGDAAAEEAADAYGPPAGPVRVALAPLCDHVTCGTLVSALLRAGQPARASALLHAMVDVGDGVAAPADAAGSEFAGAPRIAAHADAINPLVAHEASRDLAAAFDLYAAYMPRLCEPNLVSYNTLLDGCRRAGDRARALGLFRDMREAGVAMDARTYAALVPLQETPEGVFKLLRMAPKFTKPLLHTAVTTLGRLGDVESALKAYSKIRGPTLVSNNALLAALVHDRQGLLTRRVGEAEGGEGAGAAPGGGAVVGGEGGGAAAAPGDAVDAAVAAMAGCAPAKAATGAQAAFRAGLTGLPTLVAAVRVLARMRDAGRPADAPDATSYTTVVRACAAAAASDARAVAWCRALADMAAEADVCNGYVLNAALAAHGDPKIAARFWLDRRPALGPDPDPSELRAGWHGLLAVAARAARPEFGLRTLYSMRKDGVEPDAASLATYRNARRPGAPVPFQLAGMKGSFFDKRYEDAICVECGGGSMTEEEPSALKRIRILL